jgi:hypothetical protein
MIGAMAAGLVFTAVHSVPAYSRLASSARTVRHYLRDFRSAKDLSPAERLLFSVLLAKSEKRPEAKSQAVAAQSMEAANSTF